MIVETDEEPSTPTLEVDEHTVDLSNAIGTAPVNGQDNEGKQDFSGCFR